LDKEWLYKTDSLNSWLDESKYALFESMVAVDAGESQTIIIAQTGVTGNEVVERKSLAIKSVVDENMHDSFVDEAVEVVQAITQNVGLFAGIHFSCVGFSPEFVFTIYT
jgi:hypothetical protein